MVVTVPEALIQMPNKQAWLAAKAVWPELKVKLSVAALDLNTPLLVKVKVLTVLNVLAFVPSARPAAVSERKPLLACSMLYDMMNFLYAVVLRVTAVAVVGTVEAL